MIWQRPRWLAGSSLNSGLSYPLPNRSPRNLEVHFLCITHCRFHIFRRPLQVNPHEGEVAGRPQSARAHVSASVSHPRSRPHSAATSQASRRRNCPQFARMRPASAHQARRVGGWEDKGEGWGRETGVVFGMESGESTLEPDTCTR